MADQLYLQYWLHNYSGLTMLRHYEKLLKLFPFSQLSRHPSTFKVIAVNYNEAAVLEAPFPRPIPIDKVLAAANEFLNDDSCYRLETWWDLWEFDNDWELKPHKVALVCYGTEFQTENGEHLAIEFGLDSSFLPQPELPNSLNMIQSNIRSLLKLVHDLDDALPVDTRQLSSESGENFSEKLHAALAGERIQ